MMRCDFTWVCELRSRLEFEMVRHRLLVNGACANHALRSAGRSSRAAEGSSLPGTNLPGGQIDL
jgi:hypothetical protein